MPGTSSWAEAHHLLFAWLLGSVRSTVVSPVPGLHTDSQACLGSHVSSMHREGWTYRVTVLPGAPTVASDIHPSGLLWPRLEPLSEHCLPGKGYR